MNLPQPEKNEVLVIRVSKQTKKKLQELSKDKKFENNCSAVVRYLIEAASNNKGQ